MRHVVILTLALAAYGAGPDVDAIVRKALSSEISRQQKLENYTWEEKTVERTFDKRGKALKTETKVSEVLVIDGSEYQRLIEQDGQPLNADRVRKEQQKMDSEIARRRSESPSKRKHRIDERAKRRQDGLKFREEVLSAFSFKIAGEEILKGVDCWKIQAEPKRGYVAQSRQGKIILGKIRGAMWISKAASDLMKVDAETTDKITFGGFLARLDPGARVRLDMMRVNDELWHPETIHIGINARALLKHYNVEEEVAFRNFHRFKTESKLVAAEGR